MSASSSAFADALRTEIREAVREALTSLPASAAAPQLYKPQEAAKILGVSMTTMFQLLEEGGLPSVRSGPRLIRIDRRDLEAWIARNKHAAPR